MPFKLQRPRHKPNFNQSYLVDQILEVRGDAHSRPYHEQKVRELPEATIWMLLSETKQARLESRIQTSPARYFTDIVERQLGHKAK